MENGMTTARWCDIHQPLFQQLFATTRDNASSSSGGGGERNDESDSWYVTSFARRVAKEGRLIATSELLDGRRRTIVDSRRRRRRRHTGGGGCETTTDTIIEPLRALAVERANLDPRRDVLVFAAMNSRMFTVGGSRSILSIYRALWTLVYGSDFAGETRCRVVSENWRTVHTAHDTITFPWRSHGDVVSRFAYDSSVTARDDRETADRVTIQARARPMLTSTDLLCQYPYGRDYRLSFERDRRWTCDVSASWSSNVTGSVGAVKLLDHRFEDPREAWSLLFDIMDWCERTYSALDVYPVRRSVWDLLLISSAGNGGVATIDRRVVSACGLVDVGDVCAYAHTLRVLVLIIYLGCSYGGMSRAASVNDRVSNRSHRCVFPAKTSGVYHSLFHTSILPHRLFCNDDSAARRVDESCEESRESVAARWLRRFETICQSAATRYNLAAAADNVQG